MSSTNKLWNKIFITAALLLAFISFGAQLGSLHWIFDLFNIFHDFYFLIALSLIAGFIWLRNWPGLSLALVISIFNGFLLAPYMPIANFGQPERTTDLIIFSQNVLYSNKTAAKIAEDIQAFNPDIVFLMEYSQSINDSLEPLLNQFPYRAVNIRPDKSGLAFFSKLPFEVGSDVTLGTNKIPIDNFSFKLKEHTIQFAGTHPSSPLGRSFQENREQMLELANVVQTLPHPAIVIGDFNASPWSFIVNNLKRKGRLRDARIGFGLKGTRQQLPILGLPLDHVLISDDFKVSNIRYGNANGSDHIPIIVDLALK